MPEAVEEEEKRTEKERGKKIIKRDRENMIVDRIVSKFHHAWQNCVKDCTHSFQISSWQIW